MGKAIHLYFQDRSQIAALEWHECDDIQDISSRIVRFWYPQLTWKAIEKRAKKAVKAKHKRKLCGWPSLCFFKKYLSSEHLHLQKISKPAGTLCWSVW